ncbi:MAG: LysR family transcriptional regulator [Herbaspirillum sp.]|nr:LysR family transcriptional regulator [Herbaspirillum sp.]
MYATTLNLKYNEIHTTINFYLIMKNDASGELAFFVLLAKHANLSATARELDLTPPAVTKRLAMLERRLGVRLVNRTTRRLSLTSEGEIYLAHASRILAEINEMEDLVSSSRATPRGLLRVNAPLGFGRTTLAPLMSEYAKRNPEVEVQLELTDRPVDLVEQGFDLAVRFGELPDTRLSARRILPNRRFLCASPTYLQQHGVPQTLSDLSSHRCIIHRQNDDAYGIWRFTRNRKTEVVKVHGALSSNDGDIVLGWALDGHGLLIRSEWNLVKYLESGQLQLVLPAYKLPEADLFAFYPSRRNLSARVRTFIDFLVAEIGQAPTIKHLLKPG